MKIFKLLLTSSIFLGLNVLAAPNYPIEAFAISVKTDNIGPSTSLQFTIPTSGSYTYDYSVDCEGDGTYEVTHQTGDYTCTYGSPGTYTIAIGGFFPTIYFNNQGDKEKILEILQWGTGEWRSLTRSFHSTSNLIVTAMDNPDLSLVTNMAYMFTNTTNLTFTHSINDWNTSNITNVASMFNGAESFNKDIGNWDVSEVVNMQGMFKNAFAFNQDIGDWNISNAEYIDNLFYNAYAFNQDIGDWDTSKVVATWNMFYGAIAFNQDISKWDISNVSSMNNMFEGAHLSISNYDSLLDAWSKLDLVNDKELNAGSSNYCEGNSSRNLIMINDNWTFNDGLEVCSYYINSASKVSIENAQTEVTQVTTHSDSAVTPQYSIIGGGDKNLFTINQTSGVLSFITPPDVNNPNDRNKDNVYRVQIQSVGAEIDFQTIQVKVVQENSGALVPTIMYLLN